MQASSRRQTARRTTRRATSRNSRRPSLRSRGKISRKKRAQATRASSLTPQARAELRKQKALYQAAVKNFAAATRLFNHQHYAKARDLFEKALTGAPREVAERARMHVRLCNKMLAKPAPAPKAPADYYVLGVAELNARNLDRAIECFMKAGKAAPKRDDIPYALSAAHALKGNLDLAFESLKISIDRRPENRFLARRDEDFDPLREDPRYRPLIYPDNGTNGY